MVADERLTDLKKAYADMILNTAKEAAARIMLSERKALRLEYELKNVKEDSVQMLLRLKLMMDSKINEVQLASCTQQKKIEELEAQLQEAEDIVKDLREELSAVQAELEWFPPRKEVRHLVQVNEASKENVLAATSSKGQRSYTSLFPFKKCYISSTGLPSIILRSKETELYRNGCTHRIRACERTNDDMKPMSFAKEGEILRKTPSLGDDIECDTEGKEVIQDDGRVRSWCQVHVPLDEAACSSCLTSPSSVKHVNDIAVEEKSDEDTKTRSAIKEEFVPNGHKNAYLLQKSKAWVDFPFGNSESKASETIGVPINDRVIKYTFQRKRKRGMMTADGNASTGRSENLKRKHDECQNALSESETIKSLDKSTRKNCSSACIFV